MLTHLPLLAVAWSGAGRSTVSPRFVHLVSAAITAVFAIWFYRFANRYWRERNRRRNERVVPFTRREDRPRVVVLALGRSLLALGPVPRGRK